MSAWERFQQTRVTTLWSAARDNDVDGLRRLIDAGAALDARDARGYSALMLAAYQGNVEAFALLDAGADARRRNHAGMDARAFAVAFGRTEVVALLDRLTIS
jgi:ankyrin repeat protein